MSRTPEDREVVAENLEKMCWGEFGEFMLGESMGGNAGRYKDTPCLATNFVYDGVSGRIERFTNHSEDFSDVSEGTFRITFDEGLIIGIIFKTDPEERAKKNLERTVREYNDWKEKQNETKMMEKRKQKDD